MSDETKDGWVRVDGTYARGKWIIRHIRGGGYVIMRDDNLNGEYCLKFADSLAKIETVKAWVDETDRVLQLTALATV